MWQAMRGNVHRPSRHCSGLALWRKGGTLWWRPLGADWVTLSGHLIAAGPCLYQGLYVEQLRQ